MQKYFGCIIAHPLSRKIVKENKVGSIWVHCHLKGAWADIPDE
jgi:hypothetical protein